MRSRQIAMETSKMFPTLAMSKKAAKAVLTVQSAWGQLPTPFGKHLWSSLLSHEFPAWLAAACLSDVSLP